MNEFYNASHTRPLPAKTRVGEEGKDYVSEHMFIAKQMLKFMKQNIWALACLSHASQLKNCGSQREKI